MIIASSTKVNLTGETLKAIQEEASKASVPMSKILKSYAMEYIKLKNESELIKEGKLPEGSIIHTHLANMESRIAKVLVNNLEVIEEIKTEIQMLSVIIDHYLQLYLNHTPSVPAAMQLERIKSSEERYERFITRVVKTISDNKANIARNIKARILQDLETERNE
ncbi:hypothetical protein NOVO_01710 [Rickettsiales bacterium Ac37b]|nr:hypothetical protein NOVO_01710 [Rickettsiales bacterium Ac37b]